MWSCSSSYISYLMVAPLAAIWSTLPPPVVSPSPIIQGVPASVAHMFSHTHVTPSSNTKLLLPTIDNLTITPKTKTKEERLKILNQNSISVLQNRILVNKNVSDVVTVAKNETGAKNKTNTSNLTTSTGSHNDIHKYHNDIYGVNTDASYSDTTSDTTEDYYSWNDTITDMGTENSTDVFKVHSKIYKFQMIKVGVLCTVMSIIILS
ncbi:hypothetical protein OTU49_014937, partial [Cherax quadricarinatus]